MVLVLGYRSKFSRYKVVSNKLERKIYSDYVFVLYILAILFNLTAFNKDLMGKFNITDWFCLFKKLDLCNQVLHKHAEKMLKNFQRITFTCLGWL